MSDSAISDALDVLERSDDRFAALVSDARGELARLCGAAEPFTWPPNACACLGPPGDCLCQQQWKARVEELKTVLALVQPP